MIYAIGDVHGEAGALADLLAKLPVNESDLLVFLGDLIDRGPQSFACVDLVTAFDRCPKVLIQGNHEEAILAFLENGDFDTLSGMGGQATLDSYAAAGYGIEPGRPDSIPESHVRLYGQAEPWTLPFYITDHYIFTHAGWHLNRPIEQQVGGVLRWGRVAGAESPVWAQIVVRGHSPVRRVSISEKRRTIDVDTGCGHGGYLSAIALPSREIFTAYPASYRASGASKKHMSFE